MDGFYTALVDGSWILLGVLVLMVLAVAFALFARGDRARIPETPYGPRRGGDAPGAEGPGRASGRDPRRDAAGEPR